VPPSAVCLASRMNWSVVEYISYLWIALRPESGSVAGGTAIPLDCGSVDSAMR